MIGALTHGGIYLIKHFTQGIIYSTFKVIALILLVTASMHMKVIEYPYSEVYRKLKTISIYTVGVGAILLLSINLEVNLYNTSMIRSTLKPIQVTPVFNPSSTRRCMFVRHTSRTSIGLDMIIRLINVKRKI